MKITGPGPVSNVAKSKSAGKSGGDGSFSKFLDSASNEKEVHNTSSITKINAVNFITSIDGDEQSRRRQLAEEGEDLLDELSKIRDALLLGNLSADRLRAISAKIARIESNSSDPLLNDIIEEIKTRAAVELAKLGHF